MSQSSQKPHSSLFRKARDIGYIFLRNLFIPSNIIIASVIIALVLFKDFQESLFLGIMLVINTVLNIIQEISAWSMLEKLETLMALRVLKINSDKTEILIPADFVIKNDLIHLRLGDQMPSDGTIVSTNSFSVNEALITGESKSFSRSAGDSVLAGSIVTAGEAIVRIQEIFAASRIARMTQSIKKFSRNASPIQGAVNIFLITMGGILILTVGFVIARSFIVHESAIATVRTIGALASIVFPQGLVLTVTLLFAYGANQLFKSNVILQEINATEKLGRIKNLCMDKTGTLTETSISVESFQLPPNTTLSSEDAQSLITAYITGSGDSSQTANALKNFVPDHYSGDIVKSLAFSSDRQYGAVITKFKDKNIVVVAGGPDNIAKFLGDESEKTWLHDFNTTNTSAGKRVFCVMYQEGDVLPENFQQNNCRILAVFVLENKLREGIQATVKFFQDRGVTLRIISGDNPETVRFVAKNAGFLNTDSIITGSEMESWTTNDYETRAKNYTLFARIKPEQKEHIVDALKKHGFTAMIGDGANDALAIKKADLGIAMFDGAIATRHIASIVLRKNSFADFPSGVKLADRIIENIEIFTGIFLNQTFLGFFLFCSFTIFGYNYPLTPLNITFVTYFIIVFPAILIFSWVITTSQKTVEPSMQSFLKRMVPFPLISSLIQTGCVTAIWILGMNYIKTTDPNTLLVISMIMFGFIFFLFTPGMYGRKINFLQRIELAVLTLIEIGVMITVFYIRPITTFFNITSISTSLFIIAAPIIVGYLFIQFGITELFSRIQFNKKIK